MINVKHELNIPGRSLDSVLAGKMHKVFLYKFFRGTHVYKKPVFDTSIRKFSEKRKWSFNFSGPYIDGHLHSVTCDRSVLLAPFFKDANTIFWFEGGRFDKNGPHRFFCAESRDLSEYFYDPMRSEVYSSGLLYIFDKSFDWFIHVRDSLVAFPKDQSDYVFNLYSRNLISIDRD